MPKTHAEDLQASSISRVHQTMQRVEGKQIHFKKNPIKILKLFIQSFATVIANLSGKIGYFATDLSFHFNALLYPAKCLKIQLTLTGWNGMFS